MNNNKQHILEGINQRIHDEQPVSLWLIRWLEFGVIALCVSATMVAVSMVTIFIFDIFEKISIEDFIEQSVYTPAHFLFEWLVLAAFPVAFIVYLYRKFDLPYVKERNALFIVSVCIVISLGFGVAILAKGNFFLRTQLHKAKSSYVSNVPIRAAQRVTTHTTIKSAHAAVGIITGIERTGDSTILIIKNSQGATERYVVTNSLIREKILKGEHVVLKLAGDGVTIIKVGVVK